MAKVVKVYVVDSDGNGVSGQKVKTYGGDVQYTDSNGCTSLLIDTSEVSVYVNGFTAFSGSSSRLGQKEVFTKSGGRL